MSINSITQRIDKLVQELKALRPIEREQEQRVMQKFRLEWNYNSNNIEGNQLDYGETKALLLFGITAQGKPLKDHLEVQGHDEAIKYIQEIIKQEIPLTEHFIRELHQMILKNPYEVDAITSNGKLVKRKVNIGKYKTHSNHVITKTGEPFYFATPEETPAKMHDLISWYKNAMDSKDASPFLIAAEFHYRFVSIHPFDDGNGRLSRILMNFILMQFGLPPVVIKAEKKEEYYSALQQADSGKLEVFFDYIGTQLIHSLEIMIKGAKGESIEEENDLDKRLALIKLKAKGLRDGEVKHHKNTDILNKLLEINIIPSLEKIRENHLKITPFFTYSEISYYINGAGSYRPTIEELIERIVTDWSQENKEINDFSIRIRLTSFKQAGINAFDVFWYCNFSFRQSKYLVEINKSDDKPIFEKLYHQFLNEEEMNTIAREYYRFTLDEIDKELAKLDGKS